MASLEPIAERVFGRGDRRPGWFTRKLVREWVDPTLSTIATLRLDPGEVRLMSEDVCGYVLLGRPASLPGIARGAGVGVLAPHRGRGIGRRMLAEASARALRAGCTALEFLAEQHRVGWYTSQGFTICAEQLAMLGHGSGEPTAALPDQPEPPMDPPILGAGPEPVPEWAWLREAWTGTPAHERRFVALEGARFWLTREGRAWLVHRCELAEPIALVRGLAALRRNLPRQTPLLLYPCSPTGVTVESLHAAGFLPAQRSFVVRRDT